MKTIYLDCQMGAAGDMLMGALLELSPDQEGFLERLNQAGIPGISVEAQKSVKCGITGTHMSVLIKGEEEESLDISREVKPLESDHDHEQVHHHHHSHGHDHGHHHHFSMEDITRIIDNLNVEDKVKKDVKNIYQIIAQAESQVHGRPVAEVHFHEVGAMDAVADITGCAMLFHELGAEKIMASPVTTGYGQVRCVHGILPVPAPATALILREFPVRPEGLKESCAPLRARPC